MAIRPPGPPCPPPVLLRSEEPLPTRRPPLGFPHGSISGARPHRAHGLPPFTRQVNVRHMPGMGKCIEVKYLSIERNLFFGSMGQGRPVVQRVYVRIPDPGVPGYFSGTAGALDALGMGEATAAKKHASHSESSTHGEFGFLSSKSMTIEEKLFQFMCKVSAKKDKELVAAMKDYERKFCKSGKSEAGEPASGGSEAQMKRPDPFSGGGGGGLFGSIFGGIVGGVGKLLGGAIGGMRGLVGGFLDKVGLGFIHAPLDGLCGLAGQLGGPVLGTACTLFGFPELAPAATALGDGIGQGLNEEIAAGYARRDEGGPAPYDGSSADRSEGPGASRSDKASGKASGKDDPDEKVAFFKLQRLVEQQNQMFNCISNVLKSMNDTAMTITHNMK